MSGPLLVVFAAGDVDYVEKLNQLVEEINASAVGDALAQTAHLTKNVAGGVDVALSATEARYGIIKLTGTITANINVTVPDGTKGVRALLDATSGAYTVTFKTVSGSGVVLQKGTYQDLMIDGTNALPAHSALYYGATKAVEAVPGGASVTGSLVVSGTIVSAKGATVASAANVTLGDGNFFDITGTTTISSISIKQAGTIVYLKFDSSLTLQTGSIGASGALRLLGGSSLGVTQYDVLALISDGINWWQVAYNNN